MHRFFITTAPTGSSAPFEHTLPNGETALVYQTLMQAYNDADADDILQPAPPGTPGFCFYDAYGEPLSTVTVNLGANWRITKAITLQGGWCRLRLDGSGGGYCVRFAAVDGSSAVDCDFISGAGNSSIALRATYAQRCKFANYETSTLVTSTFAHVFNDCVFVNCISTSTGDNSRLFSRTATLRRCTIYGCSKSDAAQSDMVIVRPTNGTDPGIAPADAFVGSIPDDPTTVTDWSGSIDWDFRLKSTSPYATGGTSVTGDEPVYDLAGNRRKVGGAQGAYEVLDDVTHYARKFVPAWYTFERDSDAAPIPVWCAFSKSYTKSTVMNAYFDRTITGAQQRASSSSSWGVAYPSGRNATSAIFATTGRQLRATSDGESYCVLTFYADNPPEGAIQCKFGFEGNRVWQTLDGGNVAAPTSTSVCYVGDSAKFAPTGGQVAKTYVGGWTRAIFGTADVGELVLGLNAEATIAGKATISNFTGTSDAAFDGLVAESPAVITFKECAISDPASE